jgi:hypothetical protein
MDGLSIVIILSKNMLFYQRKAKEFSILLEIALTINNKVKKP